MKVNTKVGDSMVLVIGLLKTDTTSVRDTCQQSESVFCSTLRWFFITIFWQIGRNVLVTEVKILSCAVRIQYTLHLEDNVDLLIAVRKVSCQKLKR